MTYRILSISALIFLLLWQRCWSIKEKLTDTEKRKFWNFQKIYGKLRRKIIAIFILAEILCVLLEKHYSIETILWFSVKWFSWVILLFIGILCLISQYIVLHRITKKR